MDFTPPLSPRARFHTHRNSVELPRDETPLQSPRRSFAVIRDQSRGVVTKAHVLGDLDRAKELHLEAALKVERALADRLKDHLDLAIECLPRARNVDDFASMIFLAQNPKDRLDAMRRLALVFPYEAPQVSPTDEQRFFRRGLSLMSKLEAATGADELTSLSRFMPDLSKSIDREHELRAPVMEMLQASITHKMEDDLPLAMSYYARLVQDFEGADEVQEVARAFSRHYLLQHSEDDQMFCLFQFAKMELENTSGGNTHFRGDSFFTRAFGEYLSRTVPLETLHENLLEIVTREKDEHAFVSHCLREILKLELPKKTNKLLREITVLFPAAENCDSVISGLIIMRLIGRKITHIRSEIEDPTIQGLMVQLIKVLQRASNDGVFPEEYRDLNPRYKEFQGQFLLPKGTSTSSSGSG
ncbi:hypothetical protein [Simkania sp.]|uniref:hypothetical protein n=1 Tax=Simkania sp. TaxID=34094 RepID=UPI003B529F65